MLKINIQLFAHKKEWVLQRMGAIPSQSALVLSVRMGRRFLPAIFLSSARHPYPSR